MTDSTTYVRKASIFYVDLGSERNGHVQNGGSTGFRPCIVVSNRIACKVSPVLLVVPITSSANKTAKNMPTHMELGSILENVGKMGAPLPEFLKKMIAVLKATVDTAGDKASDGKEE